MGFMLFVGAAKRGPKYPVKTGFISD